MIGERPLAGKVAIVTGASRGIGRAIAVRLAADGAKVALNYQSNEAAATQTLEEVLAAESEGIAVRGDVAVQSDVAALVATTLQRWSRLDILVNNAGITRDGLLLRMKDDDWDAVLNTNLRGAFLCSRAAVRHMLKAGGRIINVSSVVGQVGNAGQANYAAAKAGLLGLTCSLAKEFASRNITSNAVVPGFITTDMTAALPTDAVAKLVDAIPLRRLGSPADIAGCVAFLASPQAAYITGQAIRVDGGMVMG